ncbi:MAG TPA: succinate dehydrogenase/fumarate reductase iron-sulfur subunit [Candidatus Omnitrophota bacterium]|nr:succinate dehydrogenase/fumarate reductase iron-sulfur subunit [Candidatus Omnitrophota bacterium]
MSVSINLTLRIWRQKNSKNKGRFETYKLENIDTASSFLEMLDVLNERLTKEGKEPVAFDHDCREGICGTCGAMVNGKAHGPWWATTLCQLHMREFRNNDTIVVEPWRSKGFPVVKDLVVDRSSFDRIIKAGGYISVKTGSAPEANAMPVAKEKAELAMDAAACIGCGACVAACPNASAMLFAAAKISHLGLLPQGQIEAQKRVVGMVEQMDKEGFGNCSNEYECEAACPKRISVSNIARMNREYLKAKLIP